MPPAGSTQRSCELEMQRRATAVHRVQRATDTALRSEGRADAVAMPTPCEQIVRTARRIGSYFGGSWPTWLARPGGVFGARQGSTRVEGVRQQTPTTSEDALQKLKMLSATLTERLATLETASKTCRTDALRHKQGGQSTRALLALRKAKTTDASVTTCWNALAAVEKQMDMLALADVQQEMTSAMACSHRALKINPDILSSTEDVIDELHEARDFATDLGEVMASFATSTDDADDEALIRELDELVLNAAAAETTTASTASTASTAVDAKTKHKPLADTSTTTAVLFPITPAAATAKRRLPADSERARLVQASAA